MKRLAGMPSFNVMLEKACIGLREMIAQDPGSLNIAMQIGICYKQPSSSHPPRDGLPKWHGLVRSHMRYPLHHWPSCLKGVDYSLFIRITELLHVAGRSELNEKDLWIPVNRTDWG